MVDNDLTKGKVRMAEAREGSTEPHVKGLPIWRGACTELLAWS